MVMLFLQKAKGRDTTAGSRRDGHMNMGVPKLWEESNMNEVRKRERRELGQNQKHATKESESHGGKDKGSKLLVRR